MIDTVDLSLDIPLFDGIPRDKIPFILKCLNATLTNYERQTYILSQGVSSHKTGYLYEGRAHIISYDLWGNRSILGEYRPGSVIAAEQFFGLANDTPVAIVANTSCKIIWFGLDKYIEAKPCCMVHVTRIRTNLACIAMQMNIQLIGKLDIISNRSVREKVLAYLSDQASKNGSHSFDIPYNRQELADALYVERTSLSHELSKLQQEGYITFSRKHFKLHRPLVEQRMRLI